MTAATMEREQGATPHPNLYGPPMRQFDAMPRWLRWSGLAQTETADGKALIGPTGWAIYQALVMVDHQTMGLPQRRHGSVGFGFEVRQGALERVTGFGARAIRNHAAALRELGLLSSYWEGRGGKPCRYEVSRKLLVDLYRYVGPILQPEHQGIRGVAMRDSLTNGMLIYGHHDTMPLIVQWEQLWAWQRSSLETGLPEWPDVGRVAFIVENFVEKNPESDSGSGEEPGISCRDTRNQIPGQGTLPESDSASHPESDSGTICRTGVVEQERQEQS